MPAKPDWIQHWPEIQAQIAARPRLLLALGFDGILSPTVLRPSEATVPDDTRALLTKLAASSRIPLAFLSGRSLDDVQARVRIPDAFYAGNHGMEVRGPGLTSSDGLAVSCRSDLVDALAFFARCTKHLRGVFIEDKRLTVTVHWRQADPGDGAALRELLEVIVRSHPRLKVFAGEACWELYACEPRGIKATLCGKSSRISISPPPIRFTSAKSSPMKTRSRQFVSGPKEPKPIRTG